MNLDTSCISWLVDQIIKIRRNIVCGFWIRIPSEIKSWGRSNKHGRHRWLIVYAERWLGLKVFIKPIPTIKSCPTRLSTNLGLGSICVGYCPILSSISTYKSSSCISTMQIVVSSSVIVSVVNRLRMRGLIMRGLMLSSCITMCDHICWCRIRIRSLECFSNLVSWAKRSYSISSIMLSLILSWQR